ncbi:Impact N-terminal domain-containing protein [Madurella fahalii]|uniref:Impact N-terminal domain-containing protein n=1 Tax=Madurella fahalii TaxID=1157608 RepID=A0ABQ0GEG5_9PEZI
MATQQDLQELLRLLTVGRKVPMMQAMAQIKALQAADLRSIKQIAEAPLEAVQSALKGDKSAKPLQNACKAALKRGSAAPSSGSKRGAPESGTASSAKRARNGLFMNGPVEMTPRELERSLELPLCMDEERISKTVIETNRSPLVLAFAVELLRHTMPEQPLSSRLSLAQAVVSANSRSKAVSIGLEKGPSADQEGWGEGQPRVRVMGREIAVLKRGGYEWRGEETVGEQRQPDEGAKASGSASETQAETETQTSSATATFKPTPNTSWAASQPISLKDSTFIARATHISEPSQRKFLVQSLFDAIPNLKTATHNAWAYRLRPSAGSNSNRVREESFDDGETGCGDLMLRVMREANTVDTLVVLTRWFGGTLLGPDRWRLMRNCVAGALSERLRKTGADVSLGGEAVWGLDLEGTRAKSMVGGYGSGTKIHQVTGVAGMQIHRPEAARGYLLKSFPSAAAATEEGAEATAAAGKSAKKARTQKAIEAEKEENLGLLLGALRIVFDSWADHLGVAELDRRAWAWYVAIRPDVESGQAGWGAKGPVRLSDVLNLRRKDRT